MTATPKPLNSAVAPCCTMMRDATVSILGGCAVDVCITDFTVSAGMLTIQPATPAIPPALCNAAECSSTVCTVSNDKSIIQHMHCAVCTQCHVDLHMHAQHLLFACRRCTSLVKVKSHITKC
jgi:hypothetical protein